MWQIRGDVARGTFAALSRQWLVQTIDNLVRQEITFIFLNPRCISTVAFQNGIKTIQMSDFFCRSRTGALEEVFLLDLSAVQLVHKFPSLPCDCRVTERAAEQQQPGGKKKKIPAGVTPSTHSFIQELSQ